MMIDGKYMNLRQSTVFERSVSKEKESDNELPMTNRMRDHERMLETLYDISYEDLK